MKFFIKGGSTDEFRPGELHLLCWGLSWDVFGMWIEGNNET